jgi:hypothetical protein
MIEFIQNGMELSKVREILNTVIQQLNTLNYDEQSGTSSHSHFAYKTWRCVELSIRCKDFEFKIPKGQKAVLYLADRLFKADMIVGVEGFRKVEISAVKYEQEMKIAYKIMKTIQKGRTHYHIHIVNMDSYDIERVKVFFNREKTLD